MHICVTLSRCMAFLLGDSELHFVRNKPKAEHEVRREPLESWMRFTSNSPNRMPQIWMVYAWVYQSRGRNQGREYVPIFFLIFTQAAHTHKKLFFFYLFTVPQIYTPTDSYTSDFIFSREKIKPLCWPYETPHNCLDSLEAGVLKAAFSRDFHQSFCWRLVPTTANLGRWGRN